MFARVTTVAFEGIEARAVDVQIQIGPGLPPSPKQPSREIGDSTVIVRLRARASYGM